MQIDLVPDRARRRPDPVEAADGVFAHLEPQELSAAEATRLASAVPDDADVPIPAEILCTPEPEVEPKTWSPKAIFKRLTKLYARFAKPATRDEIPPNKEAL
ncbi:hypothetical protein [Halocynthiibacter namhaensis]|uniref:hypothetical protein n=1 Tax=Halocynthiibacter namhaensis TaxID=1290553 RepID=UPI0012E06F01|nr:hypothetical protein [Halocynthiibacter namhaensis]